MPRPRSERRSPWPAVALAVLVVILLPVVYVLSAGPAHRLCQQGLIDREIVQAIYRPLVEALDRDRTGPIRSAYYWYLELWLPPQPPVYYMS